MIIGHRRDITPAELSQAARAAYQAWLDSRK
ncbi:hypothetical protein FR5810_00830 [Bordetella pertussis]|nr:hypothetical protein FR5810_00830 [Bordetella pertussis]